MTGEKKHIIGEWAQWIFRGVITIICFVVWEITSEIKRDLKDLREERSGTLQRLIQVENKSAENSNAIDRLYNRLIDHEIKHQ